MELVAVVLGWILGMFTHEAKEWITGWPERRRAKKFNLAMQGDRKAREWSKNNLSPDWREEKLAPYRMSDDIDGFWRVMWAIYPEIDLDVPEPKKEGEWTPEELEAGARREEDLSAKIARREGEPSQSSQ